VIAQRYQLPMVKQEAMRVAGRILGSPRLYRAAVQAAAAGLDFLPRFMVYNPFNAWGRQRELPATPAKTFRQWYLEHRSPPR
jgi:L-lactate dehydrogenase complex protein LldF